MTLFFEDLEIGATDSFGRYEVTREEVIAFASSYDPQPFHLDDAAAAKSIFGRIAASGWHTCSMAMRMIVDHWKQNGWAEASMGGLGMDEMRWPKPVYPGDILRCEIELLGKRASASRPEMGIVTSRWNVFNQNDELVLTLISNGIWKTRAGGGEGTARN
ncbi:MAG: MaoC family dehydratase [Sphingobium sp.]|nr:MaoC family dehydratase [Sphingobium sp.]MBP6111151.1 MaoC family dehydratase [Sphingobium sp.]MBP8669759.1 MaoC family dehydratase [Sphingobium sp.]MBP9156481.1 MaoC family dehydratase [Sphingobium sp.]MCC6480900.1 MaoC family dehydratase [Sphingomonadaceae bacterium]